MALDKINPLIMGHETKVSSKLLIQCLLLSLIVNNKQTNKKESDTWIIKKQKNIKNFHKEVTYSVSRTRAKRTQIPEPMDSVPST